MKKESIAFVVALAVLAAALAFGMPKGGGGGRGVRNGQTAQTGVLDEVRVPWGMLGERLVDEGVIDKAQFEALYANRGGLSGEEEQWLAGGARELVVTPDNVDVALNVLWAFGLANKNRILEEGPMRQYGDPGAFASTGGWTLAKGGAMEHYSAHAFVALTPAQQELVERVSKNVYRPCCNNPTHFPDCNHGMAMLGFLELMASQGAGEDEMYTAAAKLNRMWFPGEYATVDKYLALKGVNPDAKALVGAQFISATGFRQIISQVEPQTGGGGQGCSV
jgi:hypothetical protein